MERTDPYYGRVLRALVHIQGHLDDDLSIEELARVSCFSTFHFHRVFTGMVGETVMAHVRRLRLERAAYRLRYTDRPVMELALDAGYETQESFTRAFKAAFGVPPGQYRRRHRDPPSMEAPSGVHYAPGESPQRFTPAPAGDIAERVRIERSEPIRVVYLRHVGPYDQVGEIWDELMEWCGAEGLIDGDTRMFGLSHDDPAVTAAEKLRYDACVSIGRELEVEAPFAVQTLPAGELAVLLHEGPCDRLGESYAAIFGRWLPLSGREPRHGPCSEIYLNDPNITPPEDLLTEIRIPLAPKGRMES